MAEVSGEAFDRISLVVLDGVGAGHTFDTDRYPEDEGSNSLVNATRFRTLNAPGLLRMGLQYAPGLVNNIRVAEPVPYTEVTGAFGTLEPNHAGNGSPEGHQALMGLRVDDPYLLFNITGIPEDVVHDIETVVEGIVGRKVEVVRYPGTDDISGTTFINTPGIGDVHLASADPANGALKLPIYASSDSLVQIAVHQGVLAQPVIEQIGKAVRESFNANGRRIARVIMRPFLGTEPGNFERVESDRRDYSMDPDGSTLIDDLGAAGIPVLGIGKTASMFNGQGFGPDASLKLHDDVERVKETLRQIREGARRGLIFTNLVATDERYGHRRNPAGYVGHIDLMDQTFQEIMLAMGERDLLVVTSDHGNDPTWEPHTNHTREQVPVVAYSRSMKRPVNLGRRTGFGDVAATIAENFRLDDKEPGKSFLGQLVG